MEEKTTKRSLIKELFTNELYIDLLRITMVNTDNNRKGKMIKKALTDAGIEYTGLGSGTNRMAVLIDGYAVKFALDKDGMIDNQREAVYTKPLQPDVIRVYECAPSGLIMVCEFIDIFTLEDFQRNEAKMREILKRITDAGFLIGDCGINSKNYVNWGTRKDGSICILDFAYIYSTKSNIFVCTCDDMSFLKYDGKFHNLVCPSCGNTYTFGAIRRRITRKQQSEEIGDIRRLGYNLTEGRQEVTKVPEFEPEVRSKKKEKTETQYDQIVKNAKAEAKRLKELYNF